MLRFIGLDIGTTTISAVAVNGETGEVLRAVTVNNDTAVSSGDSSRRMQNPEAIISKVCALKDGLAREFAPISAIGVTGQMHGVLYLDANGKAVSPLYTWQDASGNLPYGQSTYAEYLSEKTGYPLASGYGLVTDFVNRDKGCVPDTAVTLCTIHDYAVMVLTGRTRPLMHSSDAASLGCFDTEKNCFDAAAIESIGLSAGFLPEVVCGAETAGYDTNGIPVAAAIGDNQASVIGSVNGKSCALVNIGTGSQVSIITNKHAVLNDCELRPLNSGLYLLVGAPLCGGRSFALLHSFFKECASLFGGDTNNIYPVMDAIAAENISEHTLKVDTRFCGTRKNPEIKGGIYNITDTNLTPSQLTKGFLYGMAEELYSLYRCMLPHCSGTVTEIAASGNAIRKSPVLKAYLEEMFGFKLNIPLHREEAAFGAAVFAAAASGHYRDIFDAQKNLVHYIL